MCDFAREKRCREESSSPLAAYKLTPVRGSVTQIRQPQKGREDESLNLG